jgi:hypothetical protein
VAIPLPNTEAANLEPPDAAEVAVLSRGVLSAVTPPGGLTETQRLLTSAVFIAMTGYPATLDAPPIEPTEFATRLSPRTIEFRTRIVQIAGTALAEQLGRVYDSYGAQVSTEGLSTEG